MIYFFFSKIHSMFAVWAGHSQQFNCIIDLFCNIHSMYIKRPYTVRVPKSDYWHFLQIYLHTFWTKRIRGKGVWNSSSLFVSTSPHEFSHLTSALPIRLTEPRMWCPRWQKNHILITQTFALFLISENM